MLAVTVTTSPDEKHDSITVRTNYEELSAISKLFVIVAVIDIVYTPVSVGLNHEIV